MRRTDRKTDASRAGGEGHGARESLVSSQFVSMLTNWLVSDRARMRATPRPGTRRALPSVMHATNFALKRGHLLSLRMLRGELKPFAVLDITPARADLLVLLRQMAPSPVRQRDVTERLGVTRATVSRMLIQLEAMGLVVRLRSSYDRREKLVMLSFEGAARLRILVKRIMDARVVDRALRSVFRAAPGEMRRPHATLLTDLRTFAARFYDTAKTPYVARILGERPALWRFPDAPSSNPSLPAADGSDGDDIFTSAPRARAYV